MVNHLKRNLFNLNNKNILITGGNGFLGGQIVDSLLNENANVYIIDIKKSKNKKSKKQFISDITNENELTQILKYFKFLVSSIFVDILKNGVK